MMGVRWKWAVTTDKRRVIILDKKPEGFPLTDKWAFEYGDKFKSFGHFGLNYDKNFTSFLIKKDICGYWVKEDDLDIEVITEEWEGGEEEKSEKEVLIHDILRCEI